jgi:hypothetical protein
MKREDIPKNVERVMIIQKLPAFLHEKEARTTAPKKRPAG